MSNAIITITTNCINDLNLATELAQQQVVVTDIEQIHFQLANNTTVVFKKRCGITALSKHVVRHEFKASISQ
ncbi:hypothetical protein [Photobacterium phosphoreum]|uniref:hypothetical protein n=1 Tax=Photobacterium phosphoreum TaxID=659 RepID=UPI0005D358E7|nr:hypothetical protein [Photobacterium phosphoreum]KJF86506.1 hypothetical protein UB41_10660 [Photobacterium phosphoreum]